MKQTKASNFNLEDSLRASTQLQAIGKSGQEAATIIREFLKQWTILCAKLGKR